MTITAAALALAIGTTIGLLGGGGSLVAVPAFTFLLQLPPKDAVVTSLAVVGVASAAGAVSGFIRGAIPVAVALIVGMSAAAGALAGGVAGARLSDQTQMAILGMVMLIAALALWRQPRVARAEHASASRSALAVIGVSVGVLTGLVGVGGGFLIVPALVVGAGLPIREAAASSLFVIALAAFAGLVGYAGETAIAWPFILPIAAVAAAGTIAGGLVAWRLPQRRLQQAFALSLVALASFVFTRV
ncbi:MAG: sulfite exporter TauE/SafE family protein [Vicinamibacterales bacterium]